MYLLNSLINYFFK